MRQIKQSSRVSRGGGGGMGGGYELTDPDYDEKRLRKLKDDYEHIEAPWRATFLRGLTRFESAYVTGRRHD